MTTFLLIRHGSTELVGKALAGRMPGIALDDIGRGQANHLADRLAGRDIAAIYSSPLQRAVETAEPLARRLGKQVEIREGFTEVDFGAWQGRNLAEFTGDKHWSRFNTLRSCTAAPGGELMLQVQARAAKELDDLRQRHEGDTVVVFSHADVIKAAVMLYLAVPLDCHLRLEISPASVSVLELAEWGPRILAVNA